ncbi:MAG: ChbG/HpnK family deacetylase [Verrucomicrobiaceae bacterium]
MRVSFVYPMFNEIGNIERVIRSTHAVARRALDEFEIIVVNDASTDGCGELAESLRAEFPELRVLHHDRNRKLGGALKTGFGAARMDHVLYMDSDLPVAFEDVERVLRELRGDPAMVVGYRMGRNESAYRHVQSWIYNRILRLFFGLRVRDVNFAFKLFRRELVAEPLRSEGSFIDAELLLEATRRGWRIDQIGLHYHVRQAGVSTIGGPGVVPRIIRELRDYRRTRWRGDRQVIFNADDFGLCGSINEGVIAAHESGVVRSASVIATGGAFEEAAEYARTRRELNTGLHLALCGGTPVSDPAKIRSLIDEDGAFLKDHKAFVKRWISGGIVWNEVIVELRAQMKKAREAGLRITHLDSHQHLHALPDVLKIVSRLAVENGVRVMRKPHERGIALRRPLRSVQRLALSSAWRCSRWAVYGSDFFASDHFLGVMAAGRWNRESLQRHIRALRPGLTEICCHPRGAARPGEEAYDWGYSHEDELAALCDPDLPRLLEQERVRVTTFSEVFSI